MTEIEFIQEMITKGDTTAVIISEVEKKFGWKRTKSRELIKQAKAQNILLPYTGDTQIKKTVYDKKHKQYIVPSRGKDGQAYTITEQAVNDIRAEYNAGCTINDLASKYLIPKNLLKHVFSELEITHNGNAFTDAELTSKSVEELSVDLAERKKLEILKSIQAQENKRIEDYAKKWEEFVTKSLDPFADLLKGWSPPKHQPLKALDINSKNSDRVYVVGAFDWHIGGIAEARYLISGRGWNFQEATKSVNRYAEEVAKNVKNDVSGFDRCIVLLGGDLFNSITGYTANGTQLKNEVNGDTQFEHAMNLILLFLNRMLEIFGKIEVHFVRGNHGGMIDYPLGCALKNYYREDSNVEFKVYSTRWAFIEVANTLLVLDHGASDQTRAKTPRKGKAREAYCQTVLLTAPELLAKYPYRLYIQGDLHHFQHEELANFEFIQFGSLPCGDQHADALNLRNRPRQNCLIIGANGLEATHHFFFE